MHAQTTFGSRLTDLDEAWIEGDEDARWRSAPGHGPDQGARASGSSILEIDPGHRLAQHTDSAEETIIVISGTAAVTVEGATETLPPGGIALVPADAPHDVRNAGEEVLRFAAVYASTDVVTTYDAEVQPDGSRQRQPVS